MVKKLTRKVLSLVVFAAMLLMPFTVCAAIPAKPALNGNLIAGDPVIPADALYGGAPYYIYDKAANTMSVSVHPGNMYYVDFPLDSALTADSSYVISVDVALPEKARYDAYRGPVFIFRKDVNGNYLGLWMQQGATYFGTFTKAADGILGFSVIGSIDNCLPDGFNGSIKIYSTPDSVKFSVYDTNGNPVNLTYGGGHVIGAEYGWGADYVKGGAPAFGVATNATKVTFSDMLVYSPTLFVEGNLATGAPTIPAAANVYSYDAATGILSVQGMPGSKYLIDYPLSSELKAKDTYTIAFDYGTLARYDEYCGPIVVHRKTTDGKYLGFWFQKSALYHGTFSLGADGQLANVSLGSICDPLVDGKGGAIVIESAPDKVTLSVVDDKGEPVILQYSVEGTKYDIGEKHSFSYGNGGDPAFGVTMYGTNTSISNLVVLSETANANTIEIGALNNGAVTVDGTVDVNDVEAGSIVNVTVAPAEGYQLKAGTLTYTVNGKTYPITTRVGDVDGAGNVFAFQMPDGDVTIAAEFVSEDADNMATLGASYKGNDLRFVNRVYRTNARGELNYCGNYLLRADSALGAALADGVALTEQQKADLLAAVAAGTAFKVPTTVLSDRCEDYIDFAVRINGAGQDAYKDKAYVCVSYATFGNGETIFGNACIRSFVGVQSAAAAQ